jgi:hypothetical protein
MVNEGKTKVYRFDGRHSLYLPSDVVGDDRFPFKVGEDLLVRIDGQRLIVESARRK